MKKIYTVLAAIGLLFVIIGVIITANQNVLALSKNNMITLNLRRLATYSKPKNYTSLQASTITDKYLISIFLDSSDDSNGKNAILVLDKGTLRKADIGTNPITKYNFGHANDATYNNKTKELYILNGKKIYVLNADTLKLKEEKELGKEYHAIGYDEDNDQYVLASKTDGGTRFHIVNTSFEEISSFDIQTNLTRQGLTVHNGYIYYACYEAGKVTKYQSKYDGVLKAGENVIYVYDLKGQNKNVFYIPYAFRGIKYNSIQNVEFDGNKMIVGFNQNTKAGYFTPEYKSEVVKTIKVSLDNQNIVTNDGAFEATLSQNKKIISRVKNDGLNYSFKLKFTKEGNYNYIVSQTNMKNNKITYDKDEKILKVKVYYNPTTNTLEATTNASELSFTNVIEEKEPEKVEEKPKEEKEPEKVEEKPKEEKESEKVGEKPKEEKEPEKVEEKPKEEKSEKEETEEETNPPKIVDVPNTSSNSYLYIIGIIILGLNVLFIKKKANN